MSNWIEESKRRIAQEQELERQKNQAAYLKDQERIRLEIEKSQWEAANFDYLLRFTPDLLHKINREFFHEQGRVQPWRTITSPIHTMHVEECGGSGEDGWSRYYHSYEHQIDAWISSFTLSEAGTVDIWIPKSERKSVNYDRHGSAHNILGLSFGDPKPQTLGPLQSIQTKTAFINAYNSQLKFSVTTGDYVLKSDHVVLESFMTSYSGDREFRGIYCPDEDNSCRYVFPFLDTVDPRKFPDKLGIILTQAVFDLIFEVKKRKRSSIY